jgi:probable addiction module antidote protein
MKTKTIAWDSAAHLETEEDIAAYLDAVLEEGDPALVAHAIGIVARARGMSEIAKASGLTRPSLYKSLSSDGKPEFETIVKVLKALGLRLSVQA